ncbi:MAG: membrane dipeptidase [Clostridia bacterium]|nr:membrane dipeptidase [Clostridia bacterium]
MKVFDAHNDFITELKSDKKINKYINKTILDNKVFCSVWASKLNEIEAINFIEKLNWLKNQHKNLYSLVEDCHFINPENIDLVLSQKINLAGLVWNNDNNLCGGALGRANLSDFGKIVINRFEDNGTIIDTAHTNEISFNDIAKVATKPIVCSHTAMFSCLNHPRNLKDYQIKLIIESGGFVGLTFVNEFLSGTSFAKVKDVCEHIMYFAIKFGTENLCLGTDFFGTKHLPIGIKSYAHLERLKQNLLKVGFNESEIENIFYNNLNNFANKFFN